MSKYKAECLIDSLLEFFTSYAFAILAQSSSPDLPFESAWALTNIASRILDQTKAVVRLAASSWGYFCKFDLFL